ncbi:sodium/glutamate symporter [Corynebacterium glyciniphilum]|uniref:sodium/glutamate symporter n=1 Tax=Corynebacterium glyciniphilum TaxID=1404244 RepID=UPI00264EB141|nr:sodium/glutamate symporter [Corynebacterium glyciniphilum]MDN6706127.1 sodium:glutamate symporter [Corynebacterium glyciniphilum]
MEYTPFTLLTDVGWISLLLVIGNLLRRHVPVFRSLLLPSPITAGLLGLLLGPQVLGLIGLSDAMGDYTTLLIAIVFAAMPYSMRFDRSVRRGAKTMWSFSTGMFLGQWGVFILLGAILFQPVWGTEDWFGMMLPVGFVGGFGTAAAVGSSLEAAGATAASSLGFTSATVGTLAAIVGGIIIANWGIRKGKTTELPAALPWDLRSGFIDKVSERPSIGKATTNPSSIEPLALHLGVLVLTVMAAHYINQGISHLFPDVSVPLFAMSFVVGIIGQLLLRAVRKPAYLDKDTISSISGASTDYLIAFGIASIVPAAIADYWVPLVILFVLGTAYCVFFCCVVAPRFFGEHWVERGLFGWGWATAAVATGIALLKIVDPKMKSGTMNEYGVAYIGFAPFEIGMTIIAPMAVIAGWTMGLGAAALVLAAAILAAPWVFRWLPHHQRSPHV